MDNDNVWGLIVFAVWSIPIAITLSVAFFHRGMGKEWAENFLSSDSSSSPLILVWPVIIPVMAIFYGVIAVCYPFYYIFTRIERVGQNYNSDKKYKEYKKNQPKLPKATINER